MASIECYDFIAGKWIPPLEIENKTKNEYLDNEYLVSEYLDNEFTSSTITKLGRASHHMAYIF
jgi:hypothetical protein